MVSTPKATGIETYLNEYTYVLIVGVFLDKFPPLYKGDINMASKIITVQEAIDKKMTVKDILKARGIIDPKGYLEKVALKKGYDINKSIEEFEGYAQVKKFYERPVIIAEQNIFDRLGRAATIAVLAAVVLVVVAPFVAKGEEMEKINKEVIKELNASLK